ncbi:hypothetical protein GCM10009647_020250 [Streptomyces sanglieri]|uniref:Uncharacterized protein n=1 Tax=Streptomyces sanglieri TaxID=193460 RepID=A0ABW2WN31_9ACTN|nr:hypothetical protein [Streptomyces sp. Wh19]MDV9199754.1 hypothetical protein [Streptomyces sp. Wh19]
MLADGTVHPYALGVYHFTVGGKAAYGHAGSVDGYRSQLAYVPEDGLGFACLANQTRIDPLTLVNRAAGGEADLPAVQAVPGPVPLGHWLARPLGASYLSLKLRQHGITPRASRHSARLALAADLPASVLADFTGTSISNATRWTGYARRDWFDHIASRTQI